MSDNVKYPGIPTDGFIASSDLEAMVGRTIKAALAPLSINGRYWAPGIRKALDEYCQSQHHLVFKRLSKGGHNGAKDSELRGESKDQVAGARQHVLSGMAKPTRTAAIAGKYRRPGDNPKAN